MEAIEIRTPASISTLGQGNILDRRRLVVAASDALDRAEQEVDDYRSAAKRPLPAPCAQLRRMV